MSTKKEKKEKMTIEKIFESVMMSSRDNNIRFSDLQKLLIALGFHLRIKGDHFIYTKCGVEEIINIQPLGKNAKPYQVKQVRHIIKKYNLEEV